VVGSISADVTLRPEAQGETGVPNGVVKWFDRKKGFGFITGDDGNDVFVHYANIKSEGYRELLEGSPVRYDIEVTLKGAMARNVEVIESGDHSQA
jgi:CspA family cold shock protein